MEMESLFTISSNAGPFYYDLFYLIAVAAAVGLFTYEGLRRGYPMGSWILLIAFAIVFFIIGNKIFTYAPEVWKYIVDQGVLPPTSQKTILGGIIGGTIGVLLAKRWLGLNHSILDAFAVGLPIVMAIQRLGCLLTGCCFGKPTTMPWGITYGADSIPYHAHLGQGLIDEAAITSLAIHPTQLYQVLFCLGIAVLVWRMKKMWTVPGNLFFVSVLLYASFRFLSEFARDPLANGIAGELFWGLKYVQWGLLASVLLLSLFILWRETKWKPVLRVVDPQSSMFYRKLFILFMLFAIVVFGFDWFNIVEIGVMLCVILLAMSINAYFFVERLTLLRLVPITIVLCAFVFMSQTSINYPGKARSSFNTITIGGNGGGFTDLVKEKIGEHVHTGTGGCCQPLDPITHNVFRYKPVKRRYALGNVGFSRTERFGKFDKVEVGVRGYFGSEVGANVDQGIIIGVDPHVHVDSRWAGIGLGLQLGTDIYDGLAFSKDLEEPRNQSGTVHGDVRVGPYDLFFAEATFNEGLWVIPHGYAVGVGMGFGRAAGPVLGTGITNNGLYVKAQVPLEQFVIEAYYAGGKTKEVHGPGVQSNGECSEQHGYDTNVRLPSFLGLNVRYRFNYKTKDRPE